MHKMGKMRLSVLLFAVLALLPGGARAEEVRLSAIDGLSLTTATGEVLQLPGLIAPQPARVAEVLGPLVLGSAVEIEGQEADRYQHRLVTLTLPDGHDAADVLLRAGAVQLAPELLVPNAARRAAEQAARMPPQGLWTDACCRVLTAEKAEEGVKSWRVVSGRVQNVTARRDVTYVNFGADWKTDFTIVVPKRLATQLKPESWVGQEVEVRGWISWDYGPSITLVHAAQMLLPAAPGRE